MALLLTAAACGGASDTAAPLPACGKPPSPAAEQPPAGAILPDTARMTALRPDPPLTQLNAYVEQSPQQIHDWIAAEPDLEILASSPPGREIELLVSDGTHATWMSARGICDGASVLAQVIADVDDAEQLPRVRGVGQ